MAVAARLHDLLEQTREQHRQAMAHRLIQIRLVASTMWFVYHLGFGVFGGHADYRATAPLTGAYTAAAAVLYAASRRYPEVMRRSWFSLPFIDLPMIFLVQYLGTPLAETPVGNAAFSVGILGILLVVSQLSMRIRNVLAATAVAIVLQVILFIRAGVTQYSWVAALIVLGTIGGAAAAVVEAFSLLLQDLVAERTRIAREIHDTLAQGLAGVSIQLENVADTMDLSPRLAREHLDRARSLIHDSMADAREAIYCLRSDVPSTALPLALSAAVRRLSPESEAQIDVRVTGAPRQLSAHVETNLVYIAQEALRNAIRHSHARVIVIELRFEFRRVRLCIRDDGRGFRLTDARHPRFGLAGMRERAEQIGGSLDVHTAPGIGTEVEVAVRRTES